jgi:hypothetical protein
MITGTKIRLAGFITFVAGGTVGYFTFGDLSTYSTGETWIGYARENVPFIAGCVAAIIGFMMLIGIKGLKGIGRVLGDMGRSVPDG